MADRQYNELVCMGHCLEGVLFSATAMTPDRMGGVDVHLQYNFLWGATPPPQIDRFCFVIHMVTQLWDRKGFILPLVCLS